MSLKSFFSRAATEIKTSAVQPLISMMNLGRPVWTKRNYAKLADEGYKKNVIVYKAINEHITAAKQAVWVVTRVAADGTAKPVGPNDPLAKLLARPNPQQGTAAFMGAFAGFYKISGNGYIEAVKGTGRLPVELYVHRSDRMKVIAGNDGPAGYKYTVDGQSKTFPESDGVIRHLKTFNPLNDWYGLSPLEAAAYDVDIHNQSLAWNKALLDNGAKPSGALVYDPKEGSSTLDDDSYKRLKQQVDEMYSGAANAGRPMLLEGGLKWVQFGLTPSDMDYINSKNTTARDICTAFGVPPQLLGIPGDNTFSNLKEARMGFWEQAVLPDLYELRDELNAWLCPMFGDDYRLAIDEDAISALSPRREAIWDKVQGAQFLSINEKREATGYTPLTTGGDDILVPATLIPLGSSAFDEPTGSTNDDTTDDA
jgi:HK97 family phage portal protein